VKVESVVRSRRNGPLIAQAAKLWIQDDDIVLDVTYGRGRFWTEFKPTNLITHDIALDGVDFRALPEPDESVDVVVFDPPYVSIGGRTTSTIEDFNARYGLTDAPKSPLETSDLMAGGIREAGRVLVPRTGRLMVKVSDYISSGKYHAGHHYAVAAALATGFEQLDEFVHYSGTGPQPMDNLDGTPRRQVHSRRAHSFLCVFGKGR
jgi:hypothetical protein